MLYITCCRKNGLDGEVAVVCITLCNEVIVTTTADEAREIIYDYDNVDAVNPDDIKQLSHLKYFGVCYFRGITRLSDLSGDARIKLLLDCYFSDRVHGAPIELKEAFSEESTVKVYFNKSIINYLGPISSSSEVNNLIRSCNDTNGYPSAITLNTILTKYALPVKAYWYCVSEDKFCISPNLVSTLDRCNYKANPVINSILSAYQKRVLSDPTKCFSITNVSLKKINDFKSSGIVEVGLLLICGANALVKEDLSSYFFEGISEDVLHRLDALNVVMETSVAYSIPVKTENKKVPVSVESVQVVSTFEDKLKSLITCLNDKAKDLAICMKNCESQVDIHLHIDRLDGICLDYKVQKAEKV